MKAFRLEGWQQQPKLSDVPVPEPGPGQVLVKIGGAGACHSDLHLMEWPEGQLPWKVPFTLGHENAGWVAATGPGVEGWSHDDPVAVYGAWGCGRCRACRLGRETYCENAATQSSSGGGLGADGGMAEYMLVPSARFLVPLGDLDPVHAAPLTDAALTPYHAIKETQHRIEPGASVVVFGIGGLGHMAVQLLRAVTPARVIAIDTSKEKRELAREVGAHAAIDGADPDVVAQVRELTGGAGAAVVYDCVGAEQTLAGGAGMLRFEGRLMLIGLAGGSVPFSFFGVPYGASVATSYWGTIPELMEVLALAQDKRIHTKLERFTLEDAPRVYDRLREGTIEGRAVLVP
jgi:propanol-preferring alcohol dehydrogenase